MTQYDPLYGELLTSREVSEMTGFTLNQLRNYRMPERQSKMPFGFLRVGGTTLYRKAVIEAWLEENGLITPEYFQAEIDKKVPLNQVLADDPEKRKVLEKLKGITTENSWTSMATWVTDHSGLPNPTRFIHNEGKRLLAIERGIEDWKTIPTPNPDLKAVDQEGYWKIWTYGVRRAFVEANQLDVSDEEIMRIPIGDVPPLKTK
jgi:hypothetical protein